MLGQGILSNSSLQSAIGSSSILAPTSARQKKSIFAELLLTALIDAFSILVIFLLMSFSSTGEILFMSKDMELPKAFTAEVLERTPVVKVEEGQIFLEEKQMTVNELTAALLDLRKKFQELLKLGAKSANKKSAGVQKLPAKKLAKKSPNEMTIELKPATPAAAPADDSTMDLPEPIPVENVPSEGAI